MTSGTRLVVDFETRSTRSIETEGVQAYAECPHARVYCAALVDLDDPNLTPMPWVDPRYSLPLGHGLELLSTEKVGALVKRAKELHAHNASFEENLWPRAKGWPALDVTKLRCSMAVGAYHGLPLGLDPLCKALGLPGKDKKGKAAMLRLSVPRTLDALGRPVWNEDPGDLLAAVRYCMQDARIEAMAIQAMPELPPHELRIWQVDQAINRRGIALDKKLINEWLALYEADKAQKIKEFIQLTGLNPTQVAKTRDWVGERLGKKFKTFDKTIILDLLKDPALPRDVRTALEHRIDIGKTSTNKFSAARNRVGADGRIRWMLTYGGTITKRWAGRGVQPQNLPRGIYKDTVFLSELVRDQKINQHEIELIWGPLSAAASSCVRNMFVAAPGHVLDVADYASIEARGIAWGAGAEKVLDTFRTGRDVYKVAAMDVYSKEYEQIGGDERQIGKVVILACGYQGHVGAFQSMAKVYGVKVDDERAGEIVNAWRDKNPEIVAFWKTMETSAHAAVAARTTKKNAIMVRDGKAEFYIDDRFGALVMRLPSGSEIFYHDPMIETVEEWVFYVDPTGLIRVNVNQADTPGKALAAAKRLANERKLKFDPTKAPRLKTRYVLSYRGIDENTGALVRVQTYGGKLSENWTQAICRDLLGAALVRLEDAGMKVVLHVHDEAIRERPEGGGSLEEFSDLMAQVPDWAQGFPISAEGWTGRRYKK